jgi:hypothetical protein
MECVEDWMKKKSVRKSWLQSVLGWSRCVLSRVWLKMLVGGPKEMWKWDDDNRISVILRFFLLAMMLSHGGKITTVGALECEMNGTKLWDACLMSQCSILNTIFIKFDLITINYSDMLSMLKDSDHPSPTSTHPSRIMFEKYIYIFDSRSIDE